MADLLKSVANSDNMLQQATLFVNMFTISSREQYNMYVTDEKIKNWFFKKFLNWQEEKGSPSSITEFAKQLEYSRATVSQWMSGERKPSYEAALKVCEILDDYELLDIMNFARPGKNLSIDQLPPDFQKRLEAALSEVEETLKGREVSELEAAEISREIFEKHGFSANFTITE